MASYSVPQFLDSGDKIFLTMNIRQLGYFLAAFAITSGFYVLIQSLFPGIGVYALIPCIPIIGIGAYLSLGRFNGRDSEIYVLKIIIFLLKPRKMVFKRQPDFSDIEEKFKLSSISSPKQAKSLSSQGNRDIDSLLMDKVDPKNRIEAIQKLARKVDTQYTGAIIDYKKAEKLNARRSQQIQKWNKVRRKK